MFYIFHEIYPIKGSPMVPRDYGSVNKIKLIKSSPKIKIFETNSTLGKIFFAKFKSFFRFDKY